MQIQDITPELAEKMCNAYCAALEQSGVEELSPVQSAIINGFHALEYLPEAQDQEEVDRIKRLESWLANAEPHLSNYLKSFSLDVLDDGN